MGFLPRRNRVMIWQSVPLMTFLDVVLFGIALTALLVLFQRRIAFKRTGRRQGPLFIALGLFSIGFFYVADLYIMWVLPLSSSRAQALRAMETLHLEYSWWVSLLAMACILVGLVRTLRGLSQQEIELLESGEQYRKVFECSADGITLRRLRDAKLIAVNPALLDCLGYTREQFQGMHPSEVIHPDSFPTYEGVVEALAEGHPARVSLQFLGEDGRVLDIEAHVVPLVYGGELHGLSILRDVTTETRAMRDKERALEALHESEERTSKAFELSPDPMVITSLDDPRLIEVNESFERLTGYSREEAVGRTMTELGLVSDSQRGEMLSQLERQGVVRDYSITIKTRSGEKRVLELSLVPLTIARENCVLQVARDITERKRAEEERQRDFEEIARLKNELEQERDYLREEVETTLHYGEIVGSSDALGRVLAQVEAVAKTNASVLITGETGVGKELIARAIHAASQRSSGPLVKVNCSSIPGELFESEFFGHVKGAFTGAHQDRIGRFQLAHGGTLLLDEVAEIPPALQAKLLRVLQEGEFERLGEDRTRKVDVRVVSVTNRDLRAEAESGAFRSDLFYRLSVFPIEVPPLRERSGDILPLTNHFLTIACQDLNREPLSLTRAQAKALESYDWPGNIRELCNVIEHAVILSRGERLHLDLALPSAGLPEVDGVEAAESGATGKSFMTAEELEALERSNLVAALGEAGWKVSGKGGAAELLGIKPSTLRYQMKSLGIENPGRLAR